MEVNQYYGRKLLFHGIQMSFMEEKCVYGRETLLFLEENCHLCKNMVVMDEKHVFHEKQM